MKNPKPKTPEEVMEWYGEELARKDKIIDQLKRENAALLRSALNQGLKLSEFESRLKGMAQKKK